MSSHASSSKDSASGSYEMGPFFTDDESTRLINSSSGSTANRPIDSSHGGREDAGSVRTQQPANPYAQPFSTVQTMEAKIPDRQGDQEPSKDQPESCLKRCCEKCGNAVDSESCEWCMPIACVTGGVTLLVTAIISANTGKGKAQ